MNIPEQKKGKLSEEFGLSDKKAEELTGRLRNAWDMTTKVPDAIKLLTKGYTKQQKEIAFLFCMLGRRIEDNDRDSDVAIVLSRLATAINRAQD